LRAINKKSKDEHKEYAGEICRKNGVGYFYTPPAPGTLSGSNPDASPCPTGSSEVASYHTHGANDPGFDNEAFSPRDVEYSMDPNQIINGGRLTPIYVGTPGGRVRVFEPALGTKQARYRSSRLLKVRLP